MQGGSFAYISPVLAIAAQIKATNTFASDHERFLVRLAPAHTSGLGAMTQDMLGAPAWLPLICADKFCF